MDKNTFRELLRSCRLTIAEEKENSILAQLSEIEAELYQLPVDNAFESQSSQSYRDLRPDIPCNFVGNLDENGKRNAQGYFVVKEKKQ